MSGICRRLCGIAPAAMVDDDIVDKAEKAQRVAVAITMVALFFIGTGGGLMYLSRVHSILYSGFGFTCHVIGLHALILGGFLALAAAEAHMESCYHQSYLPDHD